MTETSLFHESHGWRPEWPFVGTCAREELDSGGYSIWMVVHGIKAPKWRCIDSTGPGYIGGVRDLGEYGWQVLGRAPGTPVWPVSISYKRLGDEES